MPRIIFNGEAGEAFTNETDRVLYQFVASLSNTCGVCLQYHLAISSFWPIPMHRNCECVQVLIKPGATAEPWVDFRKVLDAMPRDQKVAAVGASNYRLLKKGLVTWADLVTDTRVRTFREVVAIGKLTVSKMAGAGVRKDLAEAAWASVHTPAHEIAAAHRKALVDALADAGLTRRQINEGFGKGVAAKVRLVGPRGPAGPSPAAPIAPMPMEPLIPKLGLDPKKVKAALTPKVPTPKASEPEFKPVPSDAIKAWGEAHYGGWAESLTKPERDALIDYTSSSYVTLNAYLRGQLPGLKPREEAYLEGMAKAIDSALRRDPIPENLVVYRGFQVDKYRTDPRALPGIRRVTDFKVGDELTDTGFTSTSLSPDHPIASGRHGHVVMEIRVPKGTPGAYVAGVSVQPQEDEVVLGREVDTFRVVAVREDRIVVDAITSKPKETP